MIKMEEFECDNVSHDIFDKTLKFSIPKKWRKGSVENERQSSH